MPCCVLGLVKAPLKRSRSTADGADEDSQDQLQEMLESGALDEEQKTDNTTLLRLLEEGEKVCSTVQLYICLHNILGTLFNNRTFCRQSLLL